MTCIKRLQGISSSPRRSHESFYCPRMHSEVTARQAYLLHPKQQPLFIKAHRPCNGQSKQSKTSNSNYPKKTLFQTEQYVPLIDGHYIACLANAPLFSSVHTLILFHQHLYTVIHEVLNIVLNLWFNLCEACWYFQG